MRIDEFTQPVDTSLPFDVIDDITIYMRNDPGFYRRVFFPAVLKMQDAFKKKQNINPDEILGPAVDSAMPSYCKKFKLGRPERIFKDTDRADIIKKLYGEEMSNIRKGVYS